MLTLQTQSEISFLCLASGHGKTNERVMAMQNTVLLKSFPTAGLVMAMKRKQCYGNAQCQLKYYPCKLNLKSGSPV